MMKGKASKTKVKNKQPAEIQVTAEQLLREAKERDLEVVAAPPKQKISDPDELKDYQLRKRKSFEDDLRKNRMQITNWLKYAHWEESQKELSRARSVFERALDVHPRSTTIWLKYAEMEMKNRQVSHARNVFDRAVTLLPRVNQLWYKYTYMEEVLANVVNCRQVFERWMSWQPEEQAWQTFVNFEMRHQEVERARDILTRFVSCHPDVKNWIKFAKFEERNGFIDRSRQLYEQAMDFFGDEDERLFLAFAKFEEQQREHERALVIYRYALDKLPKDRTEKIFQEFSLYEKKHGSRQGIESVVLMKRRAIYEDKLKENKYDYDTWIDYIRMMESSSNDDAEPVRQVYERAVACLPLVKEKRHWRRYIYLWICYALFEELKVQDIDRTRQVYSFCLKVIPHKIFTFAKIWILAAKFEIRCKDLSAARKLLGHAIGMTAKEKLFREYIELEIQLREFDRCRKLYEKWLEFQPENVTTWVKFAQLESLLGETERADQIYEVAVSQERLDMPEVVWKAFIDFRVENKDFDGARLLYERLLERTQHVKVWISFAKFELSAFHGYEDSRQEDQACIQSARTVFERAVQTSKSWEDKESRMILLEAWMEFEQEKGDDSSRKKVRMQMPKKVKKRRMDNGSWQEYYDYIFPTEGPAIPNLKLLEKAKAWKDKILRDPDALETASEEEHQPTLGEINPDVKEAVNPSEVDDGNSNSSTSSSASSSSSRPLSPSSSPSKRDEKSS